MVGVIAEKREKNMREGGDKSARERAVGYPSPFFDICMSSGQRNGLGRFSTSGQLIALQLKRAVIDGAIKIDRAISE